jgi:hypothetical protein
MQTKTNVIPQEDLWPLIQSIKDKKMRVYASLLYWLASRAGELLPYQHYKTIYKRDAKGKLIRNSEGSCLIESKTKIFESKGVSVSTIKVTPNVIFFDAVPVFKSRKRTSSKPGIVPRKQNPLFEEISSFINERKALQETANKQAENSGSPPTTIYLFEKESFLESDELFYWRFKKRLDRIMAKKGFSTHSFRKTRLTKAADSGDAFYVKAISGHAGIEMASQYVAPKNLFDSMKKYEGL